jgi:hypothetical protein
MPEAKGATSGKRSARPDPESVFGMFLY